MPDLSRCKYVDGILYCWDRTGRCFVEVTVTEIDFSRLNPRHAGKIIATFIEDDTEKDKGETNA